VLIALGALWIARARPEKALAARPERQTTATHKSSYQNRARWDRPATPTEETPTLPMISGTVYDMDGAVVAGATIAASTFEVAGNIPTVTGSVESDALGRFELRLPDGSYYLSGNKEGHGPTIVIAHSGDDISLLLAKTGIVQGHVRNERNEPVQRFSIDVLPLAHDSTAAPAPLWSERFDSPDGSFRVARLPNRPVILRATAADSAPAFSPLLVGEPGKTKEIELTVTSGCTLTGTVVDGRGAPVPAVFVDAESRRGGGMAGSASMDAASQTESDLEGRFRLEHVTTGTVLVRGYDGSHAVTTVTVKVEDCAGVAPVKLTMSSGGGIAGVVRRGDGTPLPGARVMVTHRSIGYVNTVADAEGRYHFDQLPANPVRIEVQASGQHTVDTIAVKDGEVIQRDLSLFADGAGEIRGRVTAGGKPLRGVQLLVTMNHGPGGMDMRSPTTDKDGNYRVTAIADGAYLIMVSSTSRALVASVQSGSVETMDIDVAAPPAPPQAAPPAPAAPEEEPERAVEAAPAVAEPD
jgi:hypothetical protein